MDEYVAGAEGSLWCSAARGDDVEFDQAPRAPHRRCEGRVLFFFRPMANDMEGAGNENPPTITRAVVLEYMSASRGRSLKHDEAR